MQTNSSPESNLLDNPEQTQKLDRENAFLLYAAFCGDVDRTAHVIDIPPDSVRALAKELEWDRKLAPIIAMKKSGRAGDVERAMNRALNFVQAHKTRCFIEQVLRKLTGMSPRDLEAFLFPQRKAKSDSDGTVVEMRTFSTRSIADLASALEKTHMLTYLALNDTATERKEREESGDDESAAASELHMKLAQAMNASGGGSLKSPHALLADAQLASVDPTVELLPAEKPKFEQDPVLK